MALLPLPSPTSTKCLTLLDLPDELLLLLTLALDIKSLLSFRQACWKIHDVTRDASLWLSLLHKQQRDYHSWSQKDDITLVSPRDVEQLVKQEHIVSRDWPRRRLKQPSELNPRPGTTLLKIEFLSHRWLLGVHAEGEISLWNTTLRPIERQAFYNLGREGWTSCAVAVDQDELSAVFAIVQALEAGGPSTTQLFRLRLPREAKGVENEDLIEPFHDLKLPNAVTIRCIDPQRNLVAFSRSRFVDVIDWTTTTQTTIDTQSEELDDLWNGIMAIHFTGPYILCFKSRSVELHPYQIKSSTLPVLRHNFNRTNFKDVTVSTARQNHDAMVVHALVSDALRGLYYFEITITTPPIGIPSLDVTLIAQHTMEDMVFNAYSTQPFAVSRGFVSAMALGPESRRGLWVERTAGSTRRTVMTFSTRQRTEGGAGSITDASYIDGNLIYEFPDYRMLSVGQRHRILLDDITHCALHEATGQIALGNREGHILMWQKSQQLHVCH